MMRACETAAAVFGKAISGAGENAALLMKRQDEVDVERSEHDGIALPAGLDFVSEELAREQLGKLLHAILHSYVRTPLAVVLLKADMRNFQWWPTWSTVIFGVIVVLVVTKARREDQL